MGLAKLSRLYRAVILDHAEHPRNRGTLVTGTAGVTMTNPTCGDALTLQVQLGPDRRIVAARWIGHGCTISQASASMMTVAVTGKSVAAARRLATTVSELARGQAVSDADLAALGDGRALEAVLDFPARIKCATLAWWTLQRVLNQLTEGAAD